ncbi:MAG: molybdopterin dinucleotide binding domain-containing protein, partial [Mariprofundaceae bacterium]|nr:molybdopterin dinucleotide binding domain-containing protein [Mariprofundaceae bacterium]
VIVHPDTLAGKGLKAGDTVTIRSFLGEMQHVVGCRDDVARGVIFIAKRGVAGDLSDVWTATIEGGEQR